MECTERGTRDGVVPIREGYHLVQTYLMAKGAKGELEN